MAKRKFILTEAERKELLQAYRTCKDAATRTRTRTHTHALSGRSAVWRRLPGRGDHADHWAQSDQPDGMVSSQSRKSFTRTGRQTSRWQSCITEQVTNRSVATNVASVHTQRTVRVASWYSQWAILERRRSGTGRTRAICC